MTTTTTTTGQSCLQDRGPRVIEWLMALMMTILFLLATACADHPFPGTATAAQDAATVASPGERLIQQLLPVPGLLLKEGSYDFPRRPIVSQSSTPFREVTFLGGDRVLAEITGFQDQFCKLRLRRGQPVTVPRAAIASIRPVASERDLLFESFDALPISVKTDRDPAALTASGLLTLDTARAFGGAASLNLASIGSPWTWTLPTPPRIARIQFWFRVDARPATRPRDSGRPAGPLQIEFAFDAASGGSIWSLTISPDDARLRAHGATPSTTTQTVPLSKGWHCLTAAFQDDSALCMIDSSLVISTSHSPGHCRSLRMASGSDAWIDQLQISQATPPELESRPIPSGQEDSLFLQSGDQWFGRIKDVTDVAVSIMGPAGAREIPWSQIRSVDFVQASAPVASHLSDSGLVAEIQCQTFVDRPGQPPDRLTGTVTQYHAEGLDLVHPWLGRLAIPNRDIARIRPRYFGRAFTLDGRRLHLGDAIRVDFRRPIPDGAGWIAQVDLKNVPGTSDAAVWLTMDVTDLEPCGPDTPPGSPYLKELRAGRLLTEVTVNNAPAGSLNEWIRFRASSEHAERLRCRIPSSLLKQGGLNTIRLHQSARKESGTGFDNCEIANMRLEFVDQPLD